jgi:hypothetical protein
VEISQGLRGDASPRAGVEQHLPIWGYFLSKSDDERRNAPSVHGVTGFVGGV